MLSRSNVLLLKTTLHVSLKARPIFIQDGGCSQGKCHYKHHLNQFKICPSNICVLEVFVVQYEVAQLSKMLTSHSAKVCNLRFLEEQQLFDCIPTTVRLELNFMNIDAILPIHLETVVEQEHQSLLTKLPERTVYLQGSVYSLEVTDQPYCCFCQQVFLLCCSCISRMAVCISIGSCCITSLLICIKLNFVALPEEVVTQGTGNNCTREEERQAYTEKQVRVCFISECK